MSRALAAALAAFVLSAFAASADEDVQAIIKTHKTAGSGAAAQAKAKTPAATKAVPAAAKAAAPKPAAAETKAAPAAAGK